jgi:glycosyltransferase involved in cell wall biosynthesis
MAELNRLGDTFLDAPVYGFLASRLETHALRRTGGVFCNSAYTESLVAPRARQTWRVPNAIRADFFQPATDGSKRPIPTLVNVGVIGARKRQLELLRMVGEIVKSGRQMQAVFAGSLSENSEYGAAFATELRKAEAAGYAAFVGFLKLPELIRLLDSCHAFLHFPSEEAFGLVVAEAMARGLKFFGANLGGIVDIASGIDGAELHDDFESLRTGITRWLDAGAPAPMLAADEITKRYHPKVIAKRHVEIYREVLGR